MSRRCGQRVVYHQQCTTVYYTYSTYQTQIPQPVQAQNLRVVQASNPRSYSSVIAFDVPAGSYVPITYSGNFSNGSYFTNSNATFGCNTTSIVNSAAYITRERRNGRDYYIIGTRVGCTATFNISGRRVSSTIPPVQATTAPSTTLPNRASSSTIPRSSPPTSTVPVTVAEVTERLRVPGSVNISNIDLLRLKFSGRGIAPPTSVTPAEIEEALRQFRLVESTVTSESGQLLLDGHVKENAYRFLAGYARTLANYYQRHGEGPLANIERQRYMGLAAEYGEMATQIASEARTTLTARQITAQANFHRNEPSTFRLDSGSLAGLNTLEGERLFMESITGPNASSITFTVPQALINSNDVTGVNQDFERITALAGRIRTRENVSEDTKRTIYRLCVAYARTLSNHYRSTNPERAARLEVTAQMYESYLPVQERAPQSTTTQNQNQLQTTQSSTPDPNHFLNFTFGNAHSSQRNDYSRAICFDFHCGSTIVISYNGTIGSRSGIVRPVSGSTHDINYIHNPRYANVSSVLYAMRQSNGNGTGRCGIGICHGYKGNITITVNGRSHTLFVP